MANSRNTAELAPARPDGPPLAVYLMGLVEFDACLALQQRLVYETSGSRQGQISLLVCEHPEVITVGRQGSRADIRLSPVELERRGIEVRWVNRGGGAILHAPGQLAVYPIVPLEWYGYSVGEYLGRFQLGLERALAEARLTGLTQPGRHGVWGRHGLAAAVGVAVKSWVGYFGAYVNVCPATHALPAMHRVMSDSVGQQPMTSLVVERQRPVRMTQVRESLLRNLSAALGSGRYHIHTGHPLMPRDYRLPYKTTVRAG